MLGDEEVSRKNCQYVERKLLHSLWGDLKFQRSDPSFKLTSVSVMHQNLD